MLVGFAERWHSDMSYFHIPIGEMFITLDDATCLLRLPIMGRLLNYSQMSRLDALDMMVTYLGADPGETQIGINATRGVHARFSYLEKLYEYHRVSLMENEGDDKKTLYHRQCAIRSYLMHLVSKTIFLDKSATCIDVVYLTYYIDLERSMRTKRGIFLDYLYSKLGEACLWKTRELTGSCTLLTVIYLYFQCY